MLFRLSTCSSSGSKAVNITFLQKSNVRGACCSCLYYFHGSISKPVYQSKQRMKKINLSHWPQWHLEGHQCTCNSLYSRILLCLVYPLFPLGCFLKEVLIPESTSERRWDLWVERSGIKLLQSKKCVKKLTCEQRINMEQGCTSRQSGSEQRQFVKLTFSNIQFGLYGQT